MPGSSKLLWLRVGDGGDYHSFDDIDAAVEFLNSIGVGRIEGWTKAGAGFTTCNYWGHDYISCYWGDKNAQLISGIVPADRDAFDKLEESYL